MPSLEAPEVNKLHRCSFITFDQTVVEKLGPSQLWEFINEWAVRAALLEECRSLGLLTRSAASSTLSGAAVATGLTHQKAVRAS